MSARWRKIPFERFESCRAFIERLTAIKSAVVIPGSGGADDSEPFHTEVIDEAEEPTVKPATTTGPITNLAGSPIVDLPPLPLEASAAHRPTLVIALGGCGAKTLKALLARLREQHGPLRVDSLVRRTGD